MVEIELECRKCPQCGLPYVVLERLHSECPICCFPFREVVPEEVFVPLWHRRPKG
jgi:hypothetical protein